MVRPKSARTSGTRLASRIVLAALALLVVLAAPQPELRAEDRLTVRGNYYRETSTRVLQPLVTFRKELPDERFALEAEYLLDVISSASIGAGALALGGDRVFTEMRHETTLRATTELGDWSASGFYRYTTETDYAGSNFGFGLARQFLQRTATVSLNYSASLDRAYRIMSPGERVPWTSSRDSNRLQVHYLSLGYSHVLHKQVLAGVSLEGTHAAGPQDNPYRRAQNATPELHPWFRSRIAATAWVRAALPKGRIVFEPRYRFYADDWALKAHAADMRVHFRPLRKLSLRARHRFYAQNEAYFWRDATDWAADSVIPEDEPWVSDDPKMDNFRSHTAGLKLTWYLDGISKFKGLGWLSGAWIQANYNHVFVRCDELSTTCSDQEFGYGSVRSTRFGDHRIGNLAFSLAF